jgi:hypothetical protein
MLFNSPRKAARAAVSDFLYAGGFNSIEAVADMDVADATDELLALIPRQEWQVPYIAPSEIGEMVETIILEARERVQCCG